MSSIVVALRRGYFFFVLLLLVLPFSATHAQNNIRFVNAKTGSYVNRGTSWAEPKNNLQDAINDLNDWLLANPGRTGYVFVAGQDADGGYGRYVPTESTERSGGGMLSTSFKMYAGIEVYGGFNPDDPEYDAANPTESPRLRHMKNGMTWEENLAAIEQNIVRGDAISAMWDFKYPTVLSGNHSNVPATFTFDRTHGRYNTSFPGSSYHVVWFATNDTINDFYNSGNNKIQYHYKPLESLSVLDGVTIQEGNAGQKTTTWHDHMAYGGGVYMVGNSKIRNCIVERCVATIRGGGVYMDGGGEMESCYVHTCQATGVGIVQGYGGAVCIDYDGSVRNSYLIQSSARIGGGLAICHVPGEYPWEALTLMQTSKTSISKDDEISPYFPYVSATLIANNTSTAEGGGVYLDEGGTMNHCTVVNNRCIGPDVTYYSRRHGRSGGVYVRTCGMLYNTVAWGNVTDSNEGIQFASVKQPETADQPQDISIYHSAFMNHDATDWSGVQKEVVISLEKDNLTQPNTTGNYACFYQPSTTAGIIADASGKIEPSTYPLVRHWHPRATSALTLRGVQVTDAVQGASRFIQHAHTTTDVLGNEFEPVSSIGALVRYHETMHYAMIAPQGAEAEKESALLPTLFVDPNRRLAGEAATREDVGHSWTYPLGNIGDATSFFAQYIEESNPDDTYYAIPEIDDDGNPTGNTLRAKYVQILVKEGVTTTAGPGNYLGNEMRTASVRVRSHMRLYAAYPGTNTGTDTSGRNPRTYVTRITANIMGSQDSLSFVNSSAHVVTFINTDSAVVDGFRLYNGNSHSLRVTYSVEAGGGVLVNNRTIEQAKRHDMRGNQLRNCVIANCAAPKGSAIYVNGEWPKGDGTLSLAELSVLNTVIRNTSSDTVPHIGTVSYEERFSESHGVVTANGNARIDMNHCTIANNVGHALKTDNKTTYDDNDMAVTGRIHVDNTAIFANSYHHLDNRDNIVVPMSVNGTPVDNGDGTSTIKNDNIEGDYNLLDRDVMGMPSGFGANSKAIFTMKRGDVNYPMFVNPSRNVGHSLDDDKPLYGGVVSYMPMNTNPMVNAASPESMQGKDRSDVLYRTYGGAADVGAIENTNLPKLGAVIYVTPEGAGKRDGSSWANAIAGNTVYAMNSGLSDHVEAQGDKLDAANGTTRLINATTGAPVLTTDDRYQGGFARAYITASTSGAKMTITNSNIWTTEVNVYDDGERIGERDTIQNDQLSESSTPKETKKGSATPGFTAGWQDLVLYPYGELSGQSRALWRAEGNLSPMHENNVTGNGNDFSFNDDYTGEQSATGMINSGALVIGNERYENYVSGLQYAVEKASAINKTNHDTEVQVWVGAGKYTDYKGYIMRDSVSVYGGFPTNKYSTPGMSERVALMADSSTVMVPKSITHTNLVAHDYETILQISDVNPRKDSITLNTDAVHYWDDNYSVADNTEQTINYEYQNRNIVHHYHLAFEDIVRSYIQYPDFKNASNDNVTVKNSANKVVDGVLYYTFGTATADLDCWHLSHPVKDNYVAKVNTDNGLVNNRKYNIYDPITQSQLTGVDATFTGHRLFVGDGSLTGLRVWQTIPNLPAGRYKLQIDMAGGYRNKFSDTAPTNMFFRIYDSDGNSCMVAVNGQSATEVMLKSIGTVFNTNDKDFVRGAHFRYELEFVQTNDGELKIQLEVEDGVRNTKAANATYGTDTGGDPENIPSAYTSNWGGNNPNRREFFMNNLHLFKLDDNRVYAEYKTDDNFSDRDVLDKKASETINKPVYSVTKHRTTLRKRVLTMPDVTNPVFVIGPGNPVGGGQDGDKVAHIERVIKQERKSWGTDKSRLYDDPNYKEYNEVYWNGFTIRHGFIYDHSSVHDGGAGVSIYEGAHLQNCIITDNFAGCAKQKGGGVFCNGSNATIEGCFILNNTTTQGSSTASDENQRQEFAGGLFLYEGTCFNSLIANNYANGFGGLGLCVGRFYNNTVAYNRGNATAVAKGNGYPVGDVGKKVGGVRIAVDAGTQLLMANTLIYGNNGLAVDITENTSDAAPFIHCYVQSEEPILKSAFTSALGNSDEGVANAYGISNVVLNGVAPSAENTPFVADVVNGVYTAGARATNNFSLRQADGLHCVNEGTEDFVSAMTNAVAAYKNYSNHKPANDTEFMNAVVGVDLPQNDVVYADRVQDCQVDIGAYEYDGSLSILPDTTTYLPYADGEGVFHAGRAIFYVTIDGASGLASGDSPENAACESKFQKILDAAGRYRYAQQTGNYFQDKSLNGYGDLRERSVEVWLAGSDRAYHPQRSTVYEGNETDNVLNYSIIVPHGVQVRGGYSAKFYKEDTDGNRIDKDGAVIDPATNKSAAGLVAVEDRDILGRPTILSGTTTSTTGAAGNVYHVVAFTNTLFDAKLELPFRDNYNRFITNQLDTALNLNISCGASFPYPKNICPLFNANRSVLDGLFIEEGYANGPDLQNRSGAAAVVPNYAHIRNCVIQNNQAQNNGGGLYLQPGALVSGTIVRQNSSDMGGGVYVEEPTKGNTGLDTYALIFSSTFVDNYAATRGGGLWFQTNARVTSSAFWHNTSNDYNNVSGLFDVDEDPKPQNYPLSYCAIEVMKADGMNNISLSAQDTLGVRWDHHDQYEDSKSSEIKFYPIEMTSTLARAGMTYSYYNQLRQLFPTLELQDIGGVNRMEETTEHDYNRYHLIPKNNDFIEIGARAINKTYEVNPDMKYVLQRLYVLNTDEITSSICRALQDNENTDPVSMYYRQMGSSFANPFHRLGDALDYVVKVRKMATGEYAQYKDRRFEIFVSSGTFYPYHDVHGTQAAARTNTFILPEEITLVGGMTAKEGQMYCQSGWTDWNKTTPDATLLPSTVSVKIGDENTTVTLKQASTDEIMDSREMTDINLNGVIEPWEFAHQTILSGSNVSANENNNIYHVITCITDPEKVGELPTHYSDEECSTSIDRFVKSTDSKGNGESMESESRRTIRLDGLSIIDGHANDLNEADESDPDYGIYNQKTYFRGGGIFVDGNWDGQPIRETVVPNVTYVGEHNIPLAITNCQFQNNMAGNGGAIYSNGSLRVYQSTFFQNYSRGPNTELDQRYIPWTAGGCIATNAYCGVANVIFANNSAERGKLPIQDGLRNPDEIIEDAEERQGIAGVISAAGDATVHALNCDFVKNEAVSYPAIFNFMPNSVYGTTEGDPQTVARYGHLEKYYAANCIFWGNRATGIEEATSQSGYKVAPQTVANFNARYDKNKNDCMHYPETARKRVIEIYEKDNPTAAELKEAADSANKVEGLYFCAFEHDITYNNNTQHQEYLALPYTTPDPTVKANQRDFRALQVEDDEIFKSLYTTLGNANHNIRISSNNTATDGPNFVKPSTDPGKNNYVPDADWLFQRINLLTDAGWSFLTQKVEKKLKWYEDRDGRKYLSAADTLTQYNEWIAAGTYTAADGKLFYDVFDTEAAGFLTDADGEYIGGGIYNYYANGLKKRFAHSYLPIGDEHYMEYFNNSEETNMQRISSRPKYGVDSVFIDIGVYEYQYIKPAMKGNQVDTIWVSEVRGTGSGLGLTPDDPTNDIQEAVERLLKSRNNHDKYVCIFEGSYTPTSMISDSRLAFTITIPNDDNVYLPDSAQADIPYGIRSLNFIGGYNLAAAGAVRDKETVLLMQPYSNTSALEHLVYVRDMENRYTMRNFLGEKSHADTCVVPITFEGITFRNSYAPYIDEGNGGRGGGAAIYYASQVRDDETVVGGKEYNKTDVPLAPFYQSLKDGKPDTTDPFYEVPKLTISNCKFDVSGVDATHRNGDGHTSALYIRYGGGRSLIVNSLFHSNDGAPIYAPWEESSHIPGTFYDNKVTVVNSTFALNGGVITLADPKSEVHNSIIWRDNLNDDSAHPAQYSLAALAAASSSSAGSSTSTSKGSMESATLPDPGEAGKVSTAVTSPLFTYNAIYDYDNGLGEGHEDEEDSQHNIALSGENNSVIAGPNFFSPLLDASATTQKLTRDFRVNPARRILSGASEEVYMSLVPLSVRREGAITDSLIRLTADTLRNTMNLPMPLAPDLSMLSPRWLGEKIERGAYECSAIIQRILYVDPRMASSEDDPLRDGTSWGDNAYGRGNLQTAIDVASIYAQTKNKSAYVYVKGGTTFADKTEGINIADNVYVVGGIRSDFLKMAYKDAIDDYSDPEAIRYFNEVHALGQQSALFSTSLIHGVNPADDNAKYRFLLDGFEIIPDNTDKTVSPITVNNDGVVLKNLLVHGFSQTSQPIVNMTAGLLYNSLIYDNTVADLSPVIRVADNALVLNVTAKSSMAEQQTIDATNAQNGSVVNAITTGLSSTYDQTTARTGNASAFLACNPTTAMFSPYMSNDLANIYRGGLPENLTNNPELSFQLHEQSAPTLNKGVSSTYWEDSPADDKTSAVSPLFEDYKDQVNFTLDRDLLGNPRSIGSSVDLGALETWLVPENSTIWATNQTNVVEMNTLDYTLPDDAKKMREAYTANYGGHYYPHAGSNVYITSGANLALQTSNGKDGTGSPIFSASDGTALRPGYVLIEDGGSLYGHGNDVQLQYLAVEKKIEEKQYDFISLPYDISFNHVTTTSYDEATDALQHHNFSSSFKAYRYNGEKRAAYNYQFADSLSACWEEANEVKAYEGWLMQKNDKSDVTARFTAWAPSGSYAYEENGDDKQVAMEQYDNRISGANGETLNFTRLEDMGWNMKGQPWLVADYLTDDKDGDGDYRMMIPHVFYQMDGDGAYLHSGEQVYTSRSWDGDAKMHLSSGFFMQSATLNNTDKETLSFRLPVLNETSKSKPMPRILLSDASGSGDVLTAFANDKADKRFTYQLGRDGIKWRNSATTALWLDDANASHLSLLGAAPTEVDIPLGITINLSEQKSSASSETSDSSDSSERSESSDSSLCRDACKSVSSERSESSESSESLRATPSPSESLRATPSHSESSERVFTFSLPTPEAFDSVSHVWLIDRTLNRTVDLKQQPYDFIVPTNGSAAASSSTNGSTSSQTLTITGRFFLRFGGFPLEKDNARTYIVYSHQRELYVRGLVAGDRIFVYGVNGVLIQTTTIGSAQTEWQTTLPDYGVFSVRVNDFTTLVESR